MESREGSELKKPSRWPPRFREEGGELSWLGRIALLASGMLVSVLFAVTYAGLLPQGTIVELVYGGEAVAQCTEEPCASTLSEGDKRGVLYIFALLITTPMGMVFWWIRTDDKKHEFMLSQRRQARTQVDEAFRLLTEENPSSRGVGLHRMCQLYREQLLDEKEYRSRLSIARGWQVVEGVPGGGPTVIAPSLDFRGILLRGAGLHGAILTGSDLRDADLAEAQLPSADCSFANLAGASFRHAYAFEANLSDAQASGADFSHAELARADCRAADLEAANFTEATLSDARLESALLTAANLTAAALDGSDLQKAKLTSASMEGAKLQRANLAGGHLDGANLQQASLISANLERAGCAGADLRGADLSGADLRDANLKGADFTGAKTDGTKFEGADTTDAKGLPPSP